MLDAARSGAIIKGRLDDPLAPIAATRCSASVSLSGGRHGTRSNRVPDARPATNPVPTRRTEWYRIGFSIRLRIVVRMRSVSFYPMPAYHSRLRMATKGRV
jgi:hypothetical protein